MKSVFSFHFCMGSGDQTKVARLVRQAPLSTEPCYWPSNIHLLSFFVLRISTDGLSFIH